MDQFLDLSQFALLVVTQVQVSPQVKDLDQHHYHENYLSAACRLQGFKVQVLQESRHQDQEHP